MRNLATQSLDSVEWLRLYRAYFVRTYPSVDISVVNECTLDADANQLCDDYPDDPAGAVEAEVASWTPP